MSKFLLLLPFLAVGFLPIYLLYLKPAPPLPHFDLQAHWGPGEPKEDTSIRPFQVQFTDAVIKDLKDRLNNHRPFTPSLEGTGFEYGFNSKVLPNWVDYWANEYNFKEREKFFNQYPQYKTKIQGLDIHFIRISPVVPAGKVKVPMLLLHGWPGSVREFYEAIPLLTAVSKDRDFVLELIIPSLPGYGFSSAAVKPGLSAAEIAVVMRNLMQRLGFEKYYIQGGDWGSIICSSLATIFPNEVLGFHMNMVYSLTPTVTVLSLLGAIYPPLVVEKELQDRMYPLSFHYSYIVEETGYMHLQSTKPDTLGVGLADSPSGLLAYILEKFSTWTRKEHRSKVDGALEFRFTKDQLLDNLMVYWTTGSITSSFRLYAETFNKRFFGDLKMDEIPTPVPTWTLQAKHEISFIPAWFVKPKFYNLVNSSVLEDGGHFLAFERPKEFSEDVLKAVVGFREWHKKNVKTEL